MVWFGSLGVVLVYGVASQKYNLKPVSTLSARAEWVWQKVTGADPTQTASKVGRIVTTFVDLSGEVIDIPGDRWRSGGGLTVWGDSLLVLDRDGAIYRLTDNNTLEVTDIKVPGNGAADYIRVAAQPEYASLTHRLNTVKYNDIQHVETDKLHGLVLSYSFF